MKDLPKLPKGDKVAIRKVYNIFHPDTTQMLVAPFKLVPAHRSVAAVLIPISILGCRLLSFHHLSVLYGQHVLVLPLQAADATASPGVSSHRSPFAGHTHSSGVYAYTSSS